jgi:hypothetical protein
MNKIMDTRLVQRQSKYPTVCTYCSAKVNADDAYYVEEGVKEHIHSLIARKFCMNCYTRYGETILLKGKK